MMRNAKVSRADQRPDAPRRWLVLLPQLAKGQSTLRVKLWRRLQALGALPLKSGAFVLPDGVERLEDLDWIVRELRDGGADALVLRAELVDDERDAELERAFVDARDAEYAALLAAHRKRPKARAAGQADASARLRRQLEQIRARDYFPAQSRSSLAEAIAGAAGEAAPPRAKAVAPTLPPPGSTWVTRAGVGVDRMASAWLVRRFVDPRARFRFVPSRRHEAREGEVRFDMLEAEFTHRDGGCTFETLLAAMRSKDPVLARIAKIVHELDLKDGREVPPETAGIKAAVTGIVAGEGDDTARLAAAARLLDALYASFGGTQRGATRGRVNRR